jgi:hypothetical protein
MSWRFIWGGEDGTKGAVRVPDAVQRATLRRRAGTYFHVVWTPD